MYEVRFHLGRGEHYRHWQIKDRTNGGVEYYNPLLYQISFLDCTLISKDTVAEKVYKSGKKDVCGWIKCDDYIVTDLNKFEPESIDTFPRLLYNPITRKYWTVEGVEYLNYNNRRFHEIITYNNKVYVHNDQFRYIHP